MGQLLKVKDSKGRVVYMAGKLPDGTYGIARDTRGICKHLKPLGHCPKGCTK